jgi:hypothetical protein
MEGQGQTGGIPTGLTRLNKAHRSDRSSLPLNPSSLRSNSPVSPASLYHGRCFIHISSCFASPGSLYSRCTIGDSDLPIIVVYRRSSFSQGRRDQMGRNAKATANGASALLRLSYLITDAR